MIRDYSDEIDRCWTTIECAWVRPGRREQPRQPVREAFELLLGLLRRIDKGDDVIFFAENTCSSNGRTSWKYDSPVSNSARSCAACMDTDSVSGPWTL